MNHPAIWMQSIDFYLHLFKMGMVMRNRGDTTNKHGILTKSDSSLVNICKHHVFLLLIIHFKPSLLYNFASSLPDMSPHTCRGDRPW